MLDMLTSQSASGYMVPWSFLFATALIASGLDSFSKRLFNPVVMTAWFFGLTVAGSLGAWTIPEIAAGAICLLTPHLLICSVAARLQRSSDNAIPDSTDAIQEAEFHDELHADPISFPDSSSEAQPVHARRAA